MVNEQEWVSVAANVKLDPTSKVDCKGNPIWQDISALATDLNARMKEMELDLLASVPLKSDRYIMDTALVNTFREDEVKPSFSRQEVLSNTTAIEAGCISVPKVVGAK